MKKIGTLLIFTLIYYTGYTQAWTQKSAVYPGNGNSGGRSTTAFSIPSLGRGYVVCGSPNYHATFEYDTLSDSWTQCLDFPSGEDGTAVGFGIDTVGYVGTGVSWGCGIYNTFYKYYPLANQWVQLPNVPGPARGYAVGFALEGKGYIGGGITGCGGSGLNDFYSYDPAQNKWDTIAPCPEGGCNQLAAGFAIGNYGYVGTGDSLAGSTGVPVNGFYRYDPSLNIWTRMADFPGGPRGGASHFATCNKGYIGLGFSDVNQSVLNNDFYEYDPAQNQWTQIANFGGSARQVASAFNIGNSCFVTLGVPSNNITETDIWEFIQTVTPAFTTASASSSNTICTGQSVSFTDTSNYSPTNWQWVFPGGTPHSSTIQNPVIEYDTAGTYDVIFSAWNGCDSAGKTFSAYVTVGAGGTLNITANPDSVCSGQISALTIASGSGAYTWLPTTGLSDSTSASVSSSPTITTTYTVTSAGGGGCASFGQVVLTVANNTEGGTVTAVRDTICQNTPGNLMLTGNSSNTVQWQSSTDSIDYTSAPHDTLANYKTGPLLQSTWFRALVGTGNCSATSTTLKLYVPPALTASFFFTQLGTNRFAFDADSSKGNIKSYHWDFGDGQTSDDSNPSHTYSQDTIHYACLTLYDGSNCSYTFCLYIQPEGVPTISAGGSWFVYPNPFSSQLTVSSKQLTVSNKIQSIDMYDVLGRVVVNEEVDNSTNTSLQLDVSSLAKGMYYIMIRTADADYVQKVVKQ